MVHAAELTKILSLGAGVQSSTVLRLAICGEIERPDHVIFADTGWEPRAVYEHLEVLKGEMIEAEMDFYVVSCGENIRDRETAQAAVAGKTGKMSGTSIPIFTNSSTGAHGMLRRSCTRNYKITPLNKKTKELAGIGRKPRRGAYPQVEQWFGISLDEIRRCRISPDWWSTFYYPLIELKMTRFDCLVWMEKRGFPPPPRSACIGCPYHSNAEWRHMRDNSPSEFEDACRFDEEMRDNSRLRNKSFLHPDLVPLREVDLSTKEDHGQRRLWDDECAGMCGV